MSSKNVSFNVVPQVEGEIASLPEYSETDPSGSSEQELHHQPTEQLGPSYIPQGATELTDDFSSGLFECHKSIPICLMTAYAPCYSWGTIHAAISTGSAEVGDHDEGQEVDWKDSLKHSVPYTVLYFAQMAAASASAIIPTTCLAGIFLRNKMKKKYGMKKDQARDAMAHLCCHCCALAQDHREMLYRERARREGYVLAQNAEEYIV